MANPKGCFVGDEMTFLERGLLLGELLHLNKCYLECIQSPEWFYGKAQQELFLTLYGRQGAQTWRRRSKLYKLG